ELGGGGCSTLQQVLVQEQAGRVTNALGWVVSTPPSWLPSVATADQLARYVRPAVRGEREECYAITEAGAGSDVAATSPSAWRDGAGHPRAVPEGPVASCNAAGHPFSQESSGGGPHPGAPGVLFVALPGPGVGVGRPPDSAHPSTPPPPRAASANVRVPAANL